MATLQRVPVGKWGDLEPEEALIGGVLQQACRDAVQTINPALSAEAWRFLDICAPDIAARLHRARRNREQGESVTDFKAHERKIAALLGGRRNIDGKGAAACDVTHTAFAVECKTRRDVPRWLLRAMQQARSAAHNGKLPIVVVHPHGGAYADDLVILRLSDFRDWFGDGGNAAEHHAAEQHASEHHGAEQHGAEQQGETWQLGLT